MRCDFSWHSPALAPPSWINSGVIWRVNWGPIKNVFRVMLELKLGLTANPSLLPFRLRFPFPASIARLGSEVIRSRTYGNVFDAGATNNQWLTVPSFHVTVPVIVSNKTTALCRPTLHWDFSSHSLSSSVLLSLPSFVFGTWRFLVRKFIVWFSGRDYHFTFYDWWRIFGILLLPGLCIYHSKCVCVCR